MEVLDENELVFQAKLLCRNFMYSRITREGLSWGKVEPFLPVTRGCVGEASLVLLKLGDELENMRPHVYRNVAKQLSISLAAEGVVSNAFLFVATDILSLGITWGKVAAVFAVAGGLAVDCVKQDRPGVVHTIEESLGEFTRKILVPWLRRRGGWSDILECVRSIKSPPQPHWLSSMVTTWKHFMKTIYIYLMKCGL
ncbi:bcl-2-related ovarian killer protein homolog B [Trichomycterus rosablanca]|uniref:bcl-2-related ovarian killer protein homolog B n=1 Tax=Trichomycterus rosablanca TaxID=2290929 RepID=UPI002F35AF30